MSTPPARIADPGSGLPADHVLETLRAQPAIQRVPNPKLTLFASRGFLDPETCAAVIDLIDARCLPSTIADANSDPAFRTSVTCHSLSSVPVFDPSMGLICALPGVDGAYGGLCHGDAHPIG